MLSSKIGAALKLPMPSGFSDMPEAKISPRGSNKASPRNPFDDTGRNSRGTPKHSPRASNAGGLLSMLAKLGARTQSTSPSNA